jgi:hypothetical protein
MGTSGGFKGGSYLHHSDWTRSNSSKRKVRVDAVSLQGHDLIYPLAHNQHVELRTPPTPSDHVHIPLDAGSHTQMETSINSERPRTLVDLGKSYLIGSGISRFSSVKPHKLEGNGPFTRFVCLSRLEAVLERLYLPSWFELPSHFAPAATEYLKLWGRGEPLCFYIPLWHVESKWYILSFSLWLLLTNRRVLPKRIQSSFGEIILSVWP